MRVTQTRYDVPGWGTGEVWSAGEVVVVHEFDFDARSSREGRAVHRDTRATCLDARPDPPTTAVAGISADLITRVRALLGGEDVVFDDVELDLDWCTAFQRSVISVLREVPRGEVVSYGELAALAGYPGAQRAAASVCARNRFAFLVPCHRVVSAEGIGGYGSAGVAVKRRLLALEGVVL